MMMVTGRDADPVSAEPVIAASVPTFTVATANTPVSLVPGIFTMPSLSRVAANAMMSGVSVAEADKKSVLTPGMIAAGLALVHSKRNCTSVGAIGAVGVNAKTNSWAVPPGMSVDAFGEPAT